MTSRGSNDVSDAEAARAATDAARDYYGEGAISCPMTVVAAGRALLDARERAEKAEALISVLKAECLASREMDRVDNSETRTDSDMREAWATLKDRRAATDAAGVALDA